MRLRKNVYNPQSKTTLDWYARAIARMRALPIDDPRSWRYQAAIHDYIDGADPYAVPGEAQPIDRDTYWRQCQHNSWFFLPWHRMYLFFFEQIVASFVKADGGPDDWALPYWNYSLQGQDVLPPEFRAAQVGGQQNPLFVPARDQEANGGSPLGGGGNATSLRCLLERAFTTGAFGASSFGGPVTEFNHDEGSQIGSLELTPHGSMHVQVGGNGGFMSSFHTAALDPVFWLHHANIDRLWSVWVNRRVAHKNPIDARWTQMKFRFHDAGGNAVELTCAQVIDTAAALNYTYDDLRDPFPAPALAGAGLGVIGAGHVANPPQMVGATSTSLKLDDSPTHATVPIQSKPAIHELASGAALGATDSPTARRVLVNIENVRSNAQAPAYDVYINAPDSVDPTKHQHLHAGQLSMFGLVESSRASAKHPGSGLNYVLDITGVLGALAQDPHFDPSQLKVSFVPVRKYGGTNVDIGRVSIYFG